MINEVVFSEVRFFRMICGVLGMSHIDVNKLFEMYGTWKHIEDNYDALEILKVTDDKVKAWNKKEFASETNMSVEKKWFCADLILTDAIMDMADEEGITWQEARNKILNSEAYTALYNFETGLWESGPDYFRDFFRRMVCIS